MLQFLVGNKIFLVEQCLTGRRDEDDDVEPQLQVSENSWAAQQAKRQVRAADEVGGVGRGIFGGACDLVAGKA